MTSYNEISDRLRQEETENLVKVLESLRPLQYQLMMLMAQKDRIEAQLKTLLKALPSKSNCRVCDGKGYIDRKYGDESTIYSLPCPSCLGKEPRQWLSELDLDGIAELASKSW